MISDQASTGGPLVNIKGIRKLLMKMKKSWDALYLHSASVATFSLKIGTCLQLNEKENELLVMGALLHDVGKMSINREIINKPGKLINSEWIELKKHPYLGSNLIAKEGGHSSLIEIIRYHHERWDGKGYEGLFEKQIPFCARIISLADSLDSMVSYRPYRLPLKIDEAISEIYKGAGSQFDPYIIEKLANELCIQQLTYSDPVLLEKLIEEEKAWLTYLKNTYIQLSNPLIYAQSQWLNRLITISNELEGYATSEKCQTKRIFLVNK